MLRKIISGGQTGADRAGLDFAIHAGLEQSPFGFTGTLKKVEINTAPADLSAVDREMIRKAGEQIEMAVE